MDETRTHAGASRRSRLAIAPKGTRDVNGCRPRISRSRRYGVERNPRQRARTRTTESRAVREEGVRSTARRVGGYYVAQFVAGAAMQLAVRIGLLVGWALPPAGSIVIAISLVSDPSKSTTVVA